MNQLVKHHPINENILDRGYYFNALFQEACNKDLLNKIQIERIQLELIELLGKEVDRYTNGESTSIQVEKAQEILQSVTFSIGAYLKSINHIEEKIELLKVENVSVMFYKGMDTVSNLKKQAFILLQNLQKNILNINNYAYQDTIVTGFPEFFHDYNIEYGAHDIPGSIDYPLLETNTDLLGVEQTYEYLRRLTLENDFLKHFSEQNINKLLQGFDKEAKHMLINLFELVLTNVIGCELSGLDIMQLDIPVEDRNWLQKHLEKWSREELQNNINVSLAQIGEKLKLNSEMMSYAMAAIPTLVVRLENNVKTDTLDRVFISFCDRILKEEFLEDGEEMEDSRLREVIEELSEIKSLQQKVIKIRETVHSINDFIELLEECFFDNEYRKVFKLLDVADRTILRKRILEDAGPEGTADYVPEKEWQRILLNLQEE